MSPERCRKVKALMMIAMVSMAEVQRAHSNIQTADILGSSSAARGTTIVNQFAGGSATKPSRPVQRSRPAAVATSALPRQFTPEVANIKIADADLHFSRRVDLEASTNHVNAFIRHSLAAIMVAAALSDNAARASNILFQEAAVDRSGFIGSIASVIESSINLAQTSLEGAGVTNTYGISICLLTLVIKALTFPLVSLQLKTTTQLVQLQPIAKKIFLALPDTDDALRRSSMTTQLYKDAKVNPLATLWPVFVQIPIFFGLSRAVRNLIAEDRLTESFLWLPSLAGPRFQEPTGKAVEWVTSIFSGSPKLGWEETAAYLSFPIALLVSQKVSQRLLSPPRDVDLVMSSMPLSLQGPLGQQIVLFVTDNWPLIIVFYFALSSSAGLTTYWLTNNLLTTLITLLVRPGVEGEVKESMGSLIQDLEKELASTLNMTLEELEPTEATESWIYYPATRIPIYIRKEPAISAKQTERKLEPGDAFRVSEVKTGTDGVRFLKLADGRGWVYDREPGVGQLCVTKKKFEGVADNMLKGRVFPALLLAGSLFLFTIK